MRIVLSGGGSGGHIVPNVALIQELKNRYHARKANAGDVRSDVRLEILYIGSRGGMEQEFISGLGTAYRGIFCGKLRRYFSWQNFADLLLIPLGILQAFFILLRWRPDVIFCKGGYVSFPVALAGWLLRRPVFIHESDVRPGLANRMAARFARKIFVSFEATRSAFPADKVVVTGNPVRPELAEGDSEVARKKLGFDAVKPVVLFMGGSLGALFLNRLVEEHKDELLEKFQIIHLTGKGYFPVAKQGRIEAGNNGATGGEMGDRNGYRAFDFVGSDLKDFYALCDVIVSRAGANSLSEIALVRKPAILIPLGTHASRGDQYDNAEAFAQENTAAVMPEESFEFQEFLATLEKFCSGASGGGTRLHGTRQRAELARGKQTACVRIINLLEEACL